MPYPVASSRNVSSVARASAVRSAANDPCPSAAPPASTAETQSSARCSTVDPAPSTTVRRQSLPQPSASALPHSVIDASPPPPAQRASASQASRGGTANPAAFAKVQIHHRHPRRHGHRQRVLHPVNLACRQDPRPIVVRLEPRIARQVIVQRFQQRVGHQVFEGPSPPAPPGPPRAAPRPVVQELRVIPAIPQRRRQRNVRIPVPALRSARTPDRADIRICSTPTFDPPNVGSASEIGYSAPAAGRPPSPLGARSDTAIDFAVTVRRALGNTGGSIVSVSGSPQAPNTTPAPAASTAQAAAAARHPHLPFSHLKPSPRSCSSVQTGHMADRCSETRWTPRLLLITGQPDRFSYGFKLLQHLVVREANDPNPLLTQDCGSGGILACPSSSKC